MNKCWEKFIKRNHGVIPPYNMGAREQIMETALYSTLTLIFYHSLAYGLVIKYMILKL